MKEAYSSAVSSFVRCDSYAYVYASTPTVAERRCLARMQSWPPMVFTSSVSSLCANVQFQSVLFSLVRRVSPRSYSTPSENFLR